MLFDQIGERGSLGRQGEGSSGQKQGGGDDFSFHERLQEGMRPMPLGERLVKMVPWENRMSLQFQSGLGECWNRPAKEARPQVEARKKPRGWDSI